MLPMNLGDRSFFIGWRGVSLVAYLYTTTNGSVHTLVARLVMLYFLFLIRYHCHIGFTQIFVVNIVTG